MQSLSCNWRRAKQTDRKKRQRHRIKLNLSYLIVKASNSLERTLLRSTRPSQSKSTTALYSTSLCSKRYMKWKKYLSESWSTFEVLLRPRTKISATSFRYLWTTSLRGNSSQIMQSTSLTRMSCNRELIHIQMLKKRMELHRPSLSNEWIWYSMTKSVKCWIWSTSPHTRNWRTKKRRVSNSVL